MNMFWSSDTNKKEKKHAWLKLGCLKLHYIDGTTRKIYIPQTYFLFTAVMFPYYEGEYDKDEHTNLAIECFTMDEHSTIIKDVDGVIYPLFQVKAIELDHIILEDESL